jgi:hypothetical protein
VECGQAWLSVLLGNQHHSIQRIDYDENFFKAELYWTFGEKAEEFVAIFI